MLTFSAEWSNQPPVNPALWRGPGWWNRCCAILLIHTKPNGPRISLHSLREIMFFIATSMLHPCFMLGWTLLCGFLTLVTLLPASLHPGFPIFLTSSSFAMSGTSSCFQSWVSFVLENPIKAPSFLAAENTNGQIVPLWKSNMNFAVDFNGSWIGP